MLKNPTSIHRTMEYLGARDEKQAKWAKGYPNLENENENEVYNIKIESSEQNLE
jgi:hypothetical protein